MSSFVEVPIEIDEETYDAIVELLGSENENDIRDFIVKLLAKYAENEGYVENEYDIY